jgi:hypothetical protein
MTIKNWLESINTSCVRRNAIHNMYLHNNPKYPKRSYESPDFIVSSCYDAINLAFNWRASEEGYYYWEGEHNYYENYQRLVRNYRR